MAERESTLRDIEAVDYDFIRGELARQNIRSGDLADRMGLTRVYVSQKLNGRKPFKVWEIDLVADVIGCTTDRLLKREA